MSFTSHNVFISLIFFFFAEELEGSKRGCWPVKCMSIFTSTLLSGQRTFAWAKKTGTYPALCGSLMLLPHWYMPEEMGALVLSCRCFFFFFFLILLHCIALKTSSLWVCWEEIPLHLPDLKDGTSKMKRKLDFIGPWPTNSSQCNGTDLCETCETALTRRGRGFNLCSRRHKSPSRGWKMSSNSTAVKSTHYARLRKQQHWKQ